MKNCDAVSKREYYCLLITAFATFLFAFSVISYQIVGEFNFYAAQKQQELKNFANNEQLIRMLGLQYDITYLPGFHLLNLFIFLALLKTKRFLLPFILTVIYAAMFLYELPLRYYGSLLGGEEFSPKIDFLTLIYREANLFDYIAAIFISILLFWQISILFRMLLRRLKKESVMP